MTEINAALVSIPIIVFGVTTILIIRWFLKAFLAQIKYGQSKDEKKQFLSLKFQAHERVALFLERITPDALIIREQNQGRNCQQLHAHLISAIRKEYEHNLAIQIYVSNEAWSEIKKSKEVIIKLINTCAAEVQPQNPSIELGQKIIERSGGEALVQISKALKLIKADIMQSY